VWPIRLTGYSKMDTKNLPTTRQNRGGCLLFPHIKNLMVFWSYTGIKDDNLVKSQNSQVLILQLIEIIKAGKQVFTFEDEYNQSLLALGAKTIKVEDLKKQH
jgi:hypothetical protein